MITIRSLFISNTQLKPFHTSKTKSNTLCVDGMLSLGVNGVKDVFFSSGVRWVLQYATYASKATTSSSSLMVAYLRNSLGFSKKEAQTTASKVSHLKSTKNLESIVDYLKQSGLNKSQIKCVLFTVPKLLSCKLDETLKPKLKVFQDLGYAGSDLADLICVNRRVWSLSLKVRILPTIELLKTVITNDENLLRALKQSPWLLWDSAQKHLPLNVALLKSYGVSPKDIEHLLLKKPRYFIMDPKWLEAVLIKVEETCRIPRGFRMFTEAIQVIASLSEKTIESKIELFKSFGWTESEIMSLFRTNPRSLGLSKPTISSKLSFFMKDLGYDAAQIVACPFALNYSLEKRILPRSAVFSVLKDKGLVKADYPFFYCLYPSESQFLKKYVLPFKEEVLLLYEDHMKSTGSRVQAAK